MSPQRKRAIISVALIAIGIALVCTINLLGDFPVSPDDPPSYHDNYIGDSISLVTSFVAIQSLIGLLEWLRHRRLKAAAGEPK